MSDFLLNTSAFLGAIVLSVHVGKHAVRHSLRQWCNTQLEDLGGDTRYTEGYRDALEHLQSEIKQRKFVFQIKTDGEI